MQTVYDYVIVGAGLTGLNLAWQLKKHKPEKSVVILEKSKGCGGRMATRRIEDLKFDHGAQYLRGRESSAEFLEFCLKEGIAQEFSPAGASAYCGVGGMTQLVKKLAAFFDVVYETRALNLLQSNEGWQVNTDQQKTFSARQVILTCPLPQSLELLQTSGISFNASLKERKYAAALVLLTKSTSELGDKFKYAENVSEEVFSITSQKDKGLSSAHTYTFVMTPSWSESFFNEGDAVIAEQAANVFAQQVSPEIEILQVKKWKYSHPLNPGSEDFYSPAPGLYLAGDAFAGASLLGALKSSNALSLVLN